jgi:putative glutamine amidotransferase
MKPVIGLVPIVDKKRECTWMLPGYEELLMASGAIPLVLPITDSEADLRQTASMLDGVLLTGGHDIDPATYGQQRQPWCDESTPERDVMENLLIDAALAEGLPILGICRGIQMLNVHLGGTLCQDIPTERPSEIDHHMAKPYDRVAHEVDVAEGSLLAGIVGAGRLGVNSCHHQAIRDLASGLRVAARASDGVIEATELEGRDFVLCVQWHPELSWHVDEASREIARAFVEAASAHAA